MSVKFYLSVIVILCFTTTALAQKQNVYYLKNDGKEVSTKDSSDFIRIISEPDSGSNLFNIKEYYPNGNIRMIGKNKSATALLLEGQCLQLYLTGKRKEIANYINGKLSGDIYDYYPNGKLHASRQYVSDKFGTNKLFIKSCNDSTGKPLVEDGNGHFVLYDDDIRKITEEGDVKDGLKVGIWKGERTIRGYTVNYEESYDKGGLISGESTDKYGHRFTYTKEEVKPQYIGGEKAFAEFLNNVLKYPPEAKRFRTEGRVFIQFVVERDGSLVDFKILRDPGNGLGNEALRALKLSPKWQPGLQQGIPVRFQYTVPVNFSFNN
jgi:TonB family protein